MEIVNLDDCYSKIDLITLESLEGSYACDVIKLSDDHGCQTFSVDNPLKYHAFSVTSLFDWYVEAIVNGLELVNPGSNKPMRHADIITLLDAMKTKGDKRVLTRMTKTTCNCCEITFQMIHTLKGVPLIQITLTTQNITKVSYIPTAKGPANEPLDTVLKLLWMIEDRVAHYYDMHITSVIDGVLLPWNVDMWKFPLSDQNVLAFDDIYKYISRKSTVYSDLIAIGMMTNTSIVKGIDDVLAQASTMKTQSNSFDMLLIKYKVMGDTHSMNIVATAYISFKRTYQKHLKEWTNIVKGSIAQLK